MLPTESELTAVSRCLPKRLQPHRIFVTEQDLPIIDSIDFDLHFFFRLASELCSIERQRYATGVTRSIQFGMVVAQEGFAYAVWPPSSNVDWVIVSSHLLEKLYASAATIAWDLQRRAAIPDDEPAYLSTVKTAIDNEKSADFLISLFMALALTFIVGHELGHHAYGHEFFYVPNGKTSGSIDEENFIDQVCDATNTGSLDFHSLELAADHHGILLLRETLLRYTGKMFLNANQPSGQTENGELHKILFSDAESVGFLASISLFIAFFSLNIRKWKLKDVLAGTHPLGAIRFRAMFEVLTQGLRDGSAAPEKISDAVWMGLYNAVNVLSVLSVPPPPDDLVSEEERRKYFEKNMESAWSETGVKRAFYDNHTLPPYVLALRARWGLQREACKAKWRIADPLPTSRA